MTAPQQTAGIPPQIQQQLGMFQQIQQQLQQVSSQKMQYEMTLRETKRALEEVESTPDEAVIFSAVGSILIQKQKVTVKTELEEKIDSLELRINSMDKQEKAMTTKATQLQKQIQEAISSGVPAAQ
ncbi:MAG TPA: prefoldin subunit beta [Methanocorpusculum sp.]|nr:prefoldin subunit beta [Methanocorpusculum sp.]HJJ50380.1 prefoldin subunit beta [Methanocorpusculum sp.]HKL97760.1 prefoldin subunit beta [Methanocorpusculum sp.]